MNLEQARQLAIDETTPPETLIELAKNHDFLTRKYVAANPNTPAETLQLICFEFPNEVNNNAVIPLLLLENPYLLTCEIWQDFNEVKRQTDLEVKRLGWTKSQGREYLMQNYGKRSRLHLTDVQLLDFLSRLRSI